MTEQEQLDYLLLWAEADHADMVRMEAIENEEDLGWCADSTFEEREKARAAMGINKGMNNGRAASIDV